MHRISFTILGIATLGFGICIIISPQFYHSGYRFDFNFTDIRWPFGGGLLILGGLFIWSSFRKKALEADKKAKDEKQVLMCPNCIKPLYKKDCPDLKCPECSSSLESLIGFYERHPELKDREKP